MLQASFRFKPSYTLCMLFLCIHCSSLLIILSLPFPKSIQFLLSMICVGSFVYVSRYHIWHLAPEAIFKIEKKESYWILHKRNHSVTKAQILKDSFNGFSCIILHYKDIEKKKKGYILIFRDSLSIRDWKDLKIHLKTLT